MSPDEAISYINSLPVDERLRLMQQMLADMEYRVARARAELAGDAQLLAELAALRSGQPDLPGLDLPPPELGDYADSAPHDPVLGHIENEASQENGDDWDKFELPPETGGQHHTVHRQRLMDAAAQYEKLLKRYGYIRSQPSLGELANRLKADELARTKAKLGSKWAEWVARDQETLDRPKPHAWQDWVVIGDDEGEIQ